VRTNEQPLIKRPRYEDGADWASPRSVLAIVGKVELQYWYAGKSWQDRVSGTQPFKASLIRVDYTSRRHDWITVAENARLSKAFLSANAEAIDQAMKLKIAHLLNPRKTIEILNDDTNR